MSVYCKFYISIELKFLRELILIKQVDQKNDLLMMSMNLSDVAI